MAAFEFRALDDRGKIRKGVLEADSPRQVRQQLREKQWLPLEVNAASASGESHWRTWLGKGGRLNGAELALMTRQLATLIRSGLPVEQALSAVARQSGKARVERIVLSVRGRVLEGHSLAQALAGEAHSFNDMYRATVAAGEKSGHLEQVLEQLAQYLEERDDTGRTVSQALVYPAFILVFSLIIISFLMAYVVPKVVAVFTQQHHALPLLTRIMISLSDFFRDWIWLVALLLVIAVVAVVRALKNSEALRFRLHAKLTHLPLFGRLLRVSDSARLASTLGILARSGVPLVDALFIAAQVVSNLAIRQSVEEVARRVREGGSFHRALDKSGYFPPMLVQMIASGEVSGELDTMLTRAAAYQERELRATITTLVGLLGPMMLLVMAGFVVLVVLSVMLPIIQMNTFIG
jgi:general secretion pathway protein F